MTHSDRAASETARGVLAAARDDSVSLIGILEVLLRRIVVILGTASVLTGLVLIALIRKPDKYTASTSFIPQGGTQAPQGLSGLAAQFGISIPSAAGALRPDFYLDLSKSRVILRRVAQRHYDIVTDSGRMQGDLLQILGLTSGKEQARINGAVGVLWKNITPVLQKNTGAVQVAVSAANPMLAQQIAENLFTEINAYNLEVRRSQASAERKYMEQRLVDARSELRAAEDKLIEFQDQNHMVVSPELRLVQDRLNREISVKQQVFISLAQSYEQSKLAEVRDTPTLMLLEPPDLPLAPDPRHLLQYGVLTFMAGAFLGMMIALVLEFVARSRDERNPEMLALAATASAIPSSMFASFRSARGKRP